MLILILFLLTGCFIPAAIVGGAGVVGYKMGSDRATKQQIHDQELKKEIIKYVRAEKSK